MPAKLRLNVKTTLRVAVNVDAFRPQHQTEVNGHLVLPPTVVITNRPEYWTGGFVCYTDSLEIITKIKISDPAEN
jgi:hypothetical protein